MTTSIKPIASPPSPGKQQAAALKAGLCGCRRYEPWRGLSGDGLCVICLLRRAQGQPYGAAYAALSNEEQADQAAWMCEHPLTRLSGGTEGDGAAFREIYSTGSKKRGMAHATSGVNAPGTKRARTVSRPSVRTMCAPGPTCCGWRGSERLLRGGVLPPCRGCNGVLVEVAASEEREGVVS